MEKGRWERKGGSRYKGGRERREKVEEQRREWVRQRRNDVRWRKREGIGEGKGGKGGRWKR